MSFFRKLFNRPPEQPVTETGNCPYCNTVLDPKPKRKKKCPACGNSVYVRGGALITEEDLEVIFSLTRLEHFGIDRERFDREREALSVQLGRKASAADTLWRILNTLLSETDDEQTRGMIYRYMASNLQQEGKVNIELLRKSARQELLEIKEIAIFDYIRTSTVNDDLVCENCREVATQVFKLQDALAELPVPNRCTSEYGCRCVYRADLGDAQNPSTT